MGYGAGKRSSRARRHSTQEHSSLNSRQEAKGQGSARSKARQIVLPAGKQPRTQGLMASASCGDHKRGQADGLTQGQSWETYQAVDTMKRLCCMAQNVCE